MQRVPVAIAAIAFGEALPTHAAEPSPAIVGLGDSRTTELPVLTGGPVEALLAVVALGIATALATVGWLVVSSRLGRRGADGR